MQNEDKVNSDRNNEDSIENEKVSWKDKYKFSSGAILLIFYQLLSGMGAFCFILTMPMYLNTILSFSMSQTTTIFHAKNSLSNFLNIVGSIIADGFLGRARTYLSFMPVDLISMAVICVLSIYTMVNSIIVFYFILAIAGGIAGPALRTLISDQIPQDKPVMLSTYMHIIYFINNVGVIIVAYIAPILHKDIYCFNMECYPLVFLISLLLTLFSFILFLTGYFTKLFVVFEATENLLINIYKCIFIGIKQRIKLGKPEKGKSWLDYAKTSFDEKFIKDVKIALRLITFLIPHPLFWMVFDQLSSIWTLQASFMNGRVSHDFVVKADQMQTLNPILVVILIPLFEATIYPLMDKFKFKMPYRIMTGQFFTVLASISMYFIQINIDNSLNINVPIKSIEYRIYNLQNQSTIYYNGQNYALQYKEIRKFQFEIDSKVIFNNGIKNESIKITKNINKDKLMAAIIYKDQIYQKPIKPNSGGGYSDVRSIDLTNYNNSLTIRLEGTYGINKNFDIASPINSFSDYVKCGIGKFNIYVGKSNKGYLDLSPAETITLIVLPNQNSTEIIMFRENIFNLVSIAWQIIPYILVTIGEVFFNVNTGIFIYGEAPLSMKSMMLAGQYVCIGVGNILILILSKSFESVGVQYLFIICAVLVAISGIATGILGFFYLRNKEKVYKPIEGDFSTEITEF